MDNLKELLIFKNEVLDPDTPPNSEAVLVVNHNELEQRIIEMLGRYTGFPFVSAREAPEGVIPVGMFYWNVNPMNEEDQFEITLSGKTIDGNRIGHIIGLVGAGDKIHFKDFVGRSALLEIISYSSDVDMGGNEFWKISVKGFPDSPNYIYSKDEVEPVMIEFLTKSGSGSNPFLNYGQIRKRGKGFRADINNNFTSNSGTFAEDEKGDIFEGLHPNGRYIPYMRYKGVGSTADFSNFVFEQTIPALLPDEPGYEAPE